MTQTEHPEDQQILAYLKAPDSVNFGDLRLHLCHCGYCRRRTELTARLRDQGHWLESERVEVESRVADLLTGNMDAVQAKDLKNEIKRNPATMRAALHYASHAAAMGQLRGAEQRRVSIWATTTALLRECLNFHAPIWKTVPVVAVLMTVMTLFFNQYYPSNELRGGRVIAFQDSLTLQFVEHDSQPGIGFFTQQGVNSVPFAGMEVRLLDNNRLRLSWHEVDGVQVYRLKLQVFRDGQTLVLARKTLGTASTEIEMAEALTQHRYEWVLSGDTRDNRSFQTSGGFVIAGD